MVVDFDFFLRQKYAQLQQQADATTQNAQTNSVVGQAAARLDNTRSALLPAESRASIGKTLAETGLIGEQTKIVAPESVARIANMNADTNRTNIGAKVDERQGLIGISSLPGVQGIRDAILGTGGGMPAGGGQIYRTSNITPATTRRSAAGGNPGRSSVEELDAQQPPWRY